jgi:hypothetical protein
MEIRFHTVSFLVTELDPSLCEVAVLFPDKPAPASHTTGRWSPKVRYQMNSLECEPVASEQLILQRAQYAQTCAISFYVRVHKICFERTVIRAGQSGNRIPVGGKVSAPVQTDPDARQASCTLGNGSVSRGEEATAWL